MTLTERLANLKTTGQLKEHTPTVGEIAQHIETARNLLKDTKREENSLEGRFNTGNSAGHALLMAAIKMHGYRPTSEKGHRAILYSLLADLVPAATAAQDTLSRVHQLRNRAEYDGDPIDITRGLIESLSEAVENVADEVALMFKQFKQKQ